MYDNTVQFEATTIFSLILRWGFLFWSATLVIGKKVNNICSLPSHQLLWFLASITSTRDSNPDLPAPRPVALPRGHHVGDYILRKLRGHTGDFRNKFKDFLIGLFTWKCFQYSMIYVCYGFMKINRNQKVFEFVK